MLARHSNGIRDIDAEMPKRDVKKTTTPVSRSREFMSVKAVRNIVGLSPGEKIMLNGDIWVAWKRERNSAVCEHWVQCV